MTYSFVVTPDLIGLGIGCACAIGVLGGLFPAVRAAPTARRDGYACGLTAPFRTAQQRSAGGIARASA